MDTTESGLASAGAVCPDDKDRHGNEPSPMEFASVSRPQENVIGSGPSLRIPKAKREGAQGLSPTQQAELRSFLERSSASVPDALWRDFTLVRGPSPRGEGGRL